VADQNLVARYYNELPINSAAVSEVANKLPSVQYLFNTYEDKDSKSSIFKTIIVELRRLKKICETEERQFYDTVGVKGLKTLNKKLVALSDSSGIFSGIPSKFLTKDVSKLTAAFNTRVFDLILEEINKDPYLQQEISKKLFERAIGTLTQNLSKTKRESSGSSKGGFQKKTIEKIIVTARALENEQNINKRNKIIIESGLSSGVIRRVGQIVQKYLGEKNESNSTNDFALQFINYVFSQIGTISDSEFRSIVYNELISIKAQLQAGQKLVYNISPNTKVLKGFMGEIWSNCAAEFLFHDKNKHAVGMELADGREIGIDLVAQGLSFQIKRYTLINGKWSKNATQGAGSLIERADYPDNLGSILQLLFATFQFNQPYSNGETAEYESGPYADISNTLNNPTNLTNLFQKGLAGILRLTQTFSIQGSDIFGTEQQYHNTFFLINDNLVPSSVMLESIISLILQKNSKIISFQVNSVSRDANKTLGTISNNGQNKEALSDASISTYANLVKIGYKYTLDFSEIVNEAMSIGALSSESAKIK